jgi:hypothetical protein
LKVQEIFFRGQNIWGIICFAQDKKHIQDFKSQRYIGIGTLGVERERERGREREREGERRGERERERKREREKGKGKEKERERKQKRRRLYF